MTGKRGDLERRIRQMTAELTARMEELEKGAEELIEALTEHAEVMEGEDRDGSR